MQKKVFTLITSLLIGSSVITYGQVTKPVTEKPVITKRTEEEKKANRQEMEQFKKDLNLTKEQAEKFREVRKNARLSLEALRANKSKTERKEFIKQRDAIIKDHNDKLKSIFTPEQYAKWQKRKESKLEDATSTSVK